MQLSEISELHCITPIANLASILDRGILSHSRAERVAHESIAMEEVQDTRSGVVVPNGLPLHRYANLYFNARNTMMYKRHALHRGISILSVRLSVLDLPGVVVTDCNSASIGFAEFGTPAETLPTLSHDEIFARSWNHGDYYEKSRHKARMCAEVLVPERIAPEFIRGIYVSCDEAAQIVHDLDLGIRTKINPYLFFQGEPT